MSKDFAQIYSMVCVLLSVPFSTLSGRNRDAAALCEAVKGHTDKRIVTVATVQTALNNKSLRSALTKLLTKVGVVFDRRFVGKVGVSGNYTYTMQILFTSEQDYATMLAARCGGKWRESEAIVCALTLLFVLLCNHHDISHRICDYP